MNQKQINRLEMYQDSNIYLDLNTGVWSVIPIAATYKTQLSDIIDQLKTTAQQQDAVQVFLGKSLRQSKQALAQKMDILDDVLEAYAADTDNSQLLVQAVNSTTDYFRLTHEDFEIKTKNMLDLLTTEVDKLSDYGLSNAQLDDAKQSYDNFSTMRGKPRAFQVASRVATMGLLELFEEGDKVLGRLDNILKRFKRSNTAFYNGYQAARFVVKD
ncbi:MAG: hypothetical protein OCD76_09615 [Reichenbachiella sp.]